MKKLLLLLGVSSIALSASAQSNSSIMFQQQRGSEGTMSVKGRVHPSHVNTTTNGNARTTGTGVGGSWFCFAEAGNDGSSGSEGAVDLYQDSSLLVSTASPTFYWWCHGLGTSLDPKSGYFDPSILYASTTFPAPTFKVTATDAYTADSIEVLGFYHFIKNHVDTLFIDIVAAPTDSARFVTWRGTDLVSYGITGAGDTTFSVADPYYDYTTNSISSHYCPTAQHITQILNPADTDANGLMDLIYQIPTAVSVPAGGNVVAYAHFKSGFAYPFGTDIDSANTFAFISYDDGHAPLQQPNDYNGGLVVTSDESYHTANAEELSSTGEPIMVPSYFYTSPLVVHEPWFNIHLKCPTCADLAAPAVVKNINRVNAFPNPANNELSVSYTLNSSANVTVTLTNTLGQVVATQNIENANSGKATFNTVALPAGIYAYSIIANGERSTGSVSVVH